MPVILNQVRPSYQNGLLDGFYTDAREETQCSGLSSREIPSRKPNKSLTFLRNEPATRSKDMA